MSAARAKKMAPVRRSVGSATTRYGWRKPARVKAPKRARSTQGATLPAMSPSGMESITSAFTRSAPVKRPPRYEKRVTGEVKKSGWMTAS